MRQTETKDFTQLQYAAISPWGFVGLGFGEASLIDLQYYRAPQVSVNVDGRDALIPSYYSGSLPAATWRQSRRTLTFFDESTESVRVATDVNTWSGTFTGKDGVCSFDDLRTVCGQLAILRTSLRRSAEVLDRYLRRHGKGLWDEHRGGHNAASLLAASQLGSPYAVVRFLRSGFVHLDEIGTPITSRLHEFADIELSPESLTT